MIRFELDCAED